MKYVLGALALLPLFLLSVFRLLGHLITYVTFGRRIEGNMSKEEQKRMSGAGVGICETAFVSGSNRLKGYIFEAEGKEPVMGTLVLVPGHGYFCWSYGNQIRRFVQEGYRVVSYDATGCGGSEGNAPMGYPQWILDLQAVLGEVISRTSPKDIFLFGHSIGAFAVTAVLNQEYPEIKGVVACSPVNSGKEYAKFLYDAIPCIFTKQVLLVMEKYERKHFGKAAEYTGIGGDNRGEVPVLILHGKDDSVVPLKCSVANPKYSVTNARAQICIREKGGHELYQEEKVMEQIMDFLRSGNGGYLCRSVTNKP